MSSEPNIDNIKAVVFDVDGVLTDGRIGYGIGSEDEIKFFDVKDGAGITLLRNSGFKTAVISGRKSKANQKRMNELKIDTLIENCHSKASALREYCQSISINPENCMYIGDDLIDLGPMRICGLAVAVGDAVDQVKANAHWILTKAGGRGAVREAAEKLLHARGLWDMATAKYYTED